MANQKINVNPFNSIGSILIAVLLVLGLFILAQGLIKLLYMIAWGLLIGALIVDYRVVLNYGKWMFNLFKENFLMGAGVGFLTFLGYPFVFGFLFAKALLFRKVNKMKEEYTTKTEGELVDYEEVEEADEIVEEPLQLPEMQKRSNRKSSQNNNEYEDLFEE